MSTRLYEFPPGTWRPSAFEQQSTTLRIRILWAEPSSNGITTIKGYRLYPNGDLEWATETVNADAKPTVIEI